MGDLESLAQNVQHPSEKEGRRAGREGTRSGGSHTVSVCGVCCVLCGCMESLCKVPSRKHLLAAGKTQSFDYSDFSLMESAREDGPRKRLVTPEFIDADRSFSEKMSEGAITAADS